MIASSTIKLPFSGRLFFNIPLNSFNFVSKSNFFTIFLFPITILIYLKIMFSKNNIMVNKKFIYLKKLNK